MSFLHKVFAKKLAYKIEDWLSFLVIIACFAVAGGFICFVIFSVLYTFIDIIF